MEMGDSVEEEEDRRREAALAATPLLRPGFKSSKVSQAQLDKFKELHKRRLQMKEKSKDKRKSKAVDNANGSSREQTKEVDIKECKEKGTTAVLEGSNAPIAKGSTCLTSSVSILMHTDEAVQRMMPKKRQKLYWGLDTRERWERKSNM